MKKLILIKILLYSSILLSQSVSYDTSFGVDGKVIHCSSQFTGFAIVDTEFQNNKILVGQTSSSTIFGIFRRYSSEGVLDTTFGNAGFYELSTTNTSVLQPNSNYHLKDIELQNDNKIVAVGWRESFQNKFCVARILENGGLDTSFNSNGFLEVDFGTVTNKATCLKILPDGKILVGGSSGNQSEFFSLLKLNSNGTLDSSFGTLGKVQTNINGNQCLANSMAIQSDGKIVLGGYVLNSPYGYDFALARYLPNGTLDTSFGVNGINITTINAFYDDIIYKVLIQNDGKIVVVGNEADTIASQRIAVVRYLSSGTLDTSYGTLGKFISSNYDFATDAAIQIDGKIVVSGGNNDLGYSRFYVSRLNTTGSIDADFQIDSQLIIPFPDKLSFNRSILIQSDNKIVNAGSLDNTLSGCSDYSIALVRINPGVLLSIDEFDNNNFIVYPNPSNGIFSIKPIENNSSINLITIYNILGQKVYEKETMIEDEYSVDLHQVQKGTYFITITDGVSTTKKTILIK